MINTKYITGLYASKQTFRRAWENKIEIIQQGGEEFISLNDAIMIAEKKKPYSRSDDRVVKLLEAFKSDNISDQVLDKIVFTKPVQEPVLPVIKPVETIKETPLQQPVTVELTGIKKWLYIEENEPVTFHLISNLVLRNFKVLREFFESKESTTVFLVALILYQAWSQTAVLVNTLYPDHNIVIDFLACVVIELTALKLTMRQGQTIRAYIIIYSFVHFGIDIINSNLLDEWQNMSNKELTGIITFATLKALAILSFAELFIDKETAS